LANPLKPRLFLLALILLVPTVHAQDAPDTGTWTLGLDTLTLEQHEAYSGAGAAQLRQNLDRVWGNGDGTISRAEAEAYSRKYTGTFTQDDPGCFEAFGYLRLDGQGPLRISKMSITLGGAVGPTSSQAEFSQSAFFAYQYRAPATDHATATLDLDADAAFFSTAECYLGFSIGSPGNDTVSGRPFVWRIRPSSGLEIVQETVRPTAALEYWDGKGLRFEFQPGDSSDPPGLERLTFTLQTGTAGPDWMLLGYGAAGAFGLAGFALLLTELGRYKFFRLFFLVPGFTRVEKDQVLEHSTRDELYNFIKTNPGPSFSDLRRSLELSNGNLVHHLRILEMQEYVKSQRDGFRTRFYVRGPKIVATSYLTRTQQQLLDVIAAHPGLTQKDLADLVGLPRQSLFYHTKQLASRGKLLIKEDGNRRRYWLRPETGVGGLGGTLGSG
jgi:DNA-binding MarR family transcriptional regulator